MLVAGKSNFQGLGKLTAASPDGKENSVVFIVFNIRIKSCRNEFISLSPCIKNWNTRMTNICKMLPLRKIL